MFTPHEARNELALLGAQVRPTPTAGMNLHEMALEIGIATKHATYDMLYLAFAIAMGTTVVMAADARFGQSIRRHPDPRRSAMVLPVDEWARPRGGSNP